MRWARSDLNGRPADYESAALTPELRAQLDGSLESKIYVAIKGVFGLPPVGELGSLNCHCDPASGGGSNPARTEQGLEFVSLVLF